MKTYNKSDFEKATQEILTNYNMIYNGIDQTASKLASVLTRSKSKWAEYSIKDLCISPRNFDFIDTTSNTKLGKHNISFSSIIELIYKIESVLPAMSRLKIYTYIDSITIQYVDNYSVSISNCYEPYYYDDGEQRMLRGDAIKSLIEVFSITKNSKTFKRSQINLTL